MATANGANLSNLETIPLLIDGKATTADTPVQFLVHSLEEQKDVYLAESADESAANRAAISSWEAFQSWKTTSPVTRRQVLQRYAELLRSHEDELVSSQCRETSVIEMWARKNVQLAAALVDEIAASVTRLSGTIPQTQTASSLALAFTVPVGPVLSISPYVTHAHGLLIC
jgi:acyl-CoA reductase-like NAD-dependent aldehyde dehydrogenase